MPIELFTGLPGHGKTSLMVARLLDEAKKPADKARPLWAAGIDGLKPGIASILKDPRQWNAVRDGERCTCSDTDDESTCDAHVIPNGSLIFVDEAWKWFGHLHDATRQATPIHVLQLAEHRHRGIDFVWTTQVPGQIYPFARGMVADHHHVVRRFGTSLIDVFSWAELNDDVKSASKRDSALRATKPLPSHAHASYKSAEVHTIKRKIPYRVVAIPALVIGAVLCGWVTYTHLRPSAVASRIGGKPETATATAQGKGEQGSARPAAPTPLEYAQRLLPRFPTMPESAPIYDDRGVTSAAEFWCMSSGAGQTATGYSEPTVTCLTEQGTRYKLTVDEARHAARYGRPYNAFRPQQQQQQQQQPQVVSVAASAGSHAAMPGMQTDAVPFYGGMRGQVGKAPEPQGID